MIITSVEFEPDELDYLLDTIELEACSDGNAFLRCGCHMEISCIQMPSMGDLLLYVDLRLYEETTDDLPPEPVKRLHQDVNKLKLTLVNHLGDEIRSNLNWDFYEKLKSRLTY